MQKTFHKINSDLWKQTNKQIKPLLQLQIEGNFLNLMKHTYKIGRNEGSRVGGKEGRRKGEGKEGKKDRKTEAKY